MKRSRALATAGLSIAQLWAAQAFATPEADAQKFMSKYNYCDAKILAGHWKVSEHEAKVRGGAKLGANAAPVVEDALTAGRNAGKRCDFPDTGFTFEDAEALSKLWNISIQDAKATLADKLTGGYRDLAKQVVAEAHAAGKKKPAGKPNTALKPIKKPTPVKPKN